MRPPLVIYIYTRALTALIMQILTRMSERGSFLFYPPLSFSPLMNVFTRSFYIHVYIEYTCIVHLPYIPLLGHVYSALYINSNGRAPATFTLDLSVPISISIKVRFMGYIAQGVYVYIHIHTVYCAHRLFAILPPEWDIPLSRTRVRVYIDITFLSLSLTFI